MRFSWLPRYSDAYASSRLRVFTIHRQLQQDGHQSVVGWDPHADVLVVQKHEEGEAFEQASRFQGTVVYDFDDVIGEAALRRAAELADVMTTDTRGHLAWAMPYIGDTRATVVPDTIDYYPSGNSPPSDGSGAVWLGTSDTFEGARWMVDALLDAGEPVLTIADREVSPRAAFALWSVDTCPRDMRRAAVAVLSHRDGDQGKSVNKMIAAINRGLPCIVGHSREYEALADAMGLGWSIAVHELDVVEIYRRLQDPHERAHYLSVAQPAVWQRFSPAACTARLLEAVR